MSSARQKSRRIGLFVEGDTERGDARQKTLPVFFHKWLDPQLPADGRVGLTAVKFQGVSNYLDDVAQKVSLHLDEGRVNVVFGLIDLYGIPPSRIDLSKFATVPEKVAAAGEYIRNLVDKKHRDRFR
jgi:hypothetical protein